MEGIIRCIDPQGRLVIPKEVRKEMQVDCGEPVEIIVSKDGVSIKKYKPVCIICGKTKHLVKIKTKLICDDCMKELFTMGEEKKANAN